jgi:hypothetical protein
MDSSEFEFEIEDKLLWLDLNFYSSFDGFKEIVVFKNFEIENGVLGFDCDCYLSIVRFLDSSILRNV